MIMKITMALLFCLAPALRAQEADPLAWGDRPRFSKAEYIGTGTALAGSAAAFFFIPHPKTPAWRGQILFDKGARNTLRARSQGGRDRATVYSDMLSYPLVAYAMVDGPITAAIRGNKDTAIQLSLIGAEVFAVTELLNLTVSAVVRRERPADNVCDPNGKYDSHCARSFWSGHTANAFAAASLICAEHESLPLYGGGKADKGACAGALAAASAVGTLRIVSNDHHASDVIVGAAVGAAIGYLLPNYLHFKSKNPNKLGYLIPNVTPSGGGLTYIKAW